MLLAHIYVLSNLKQPQTPLRTADFPPKRPKMAKIDLTLGQRVGVFRTIRDSRFVPLGTMFTRGKFRFDISLSEKVIAS